MRQTGTIFVTGATGTIGREAVKALRSRSDVTVRAGVHSPEKAQQIAGGNVAPVPFHFDKPAVWRQAFEGVDALFLITPAGAGLDSIAKAIVDAAKSAGVGRLVRLSVIGADVEPGISLGREHRDVEKYIEASGLEWVFLRPNSFMQNFTSYYMPDENGRIFLPTGNGASSWVDTVDVGEAAAVALTDAGVTGKSYVLTGPEALTVAQVATILSQVSGRDIQHVDVPEEATREALLGLGIPRGYADALVELYGIIKAGYTADTAPGVQQLIGRPPRRFEDFARANAGVWRR